QRRSRGARLLFGMLTVIPLLVLFPPTAGFLGQFTTPWLFFRLHWPVSMAAVLTVGWAVWMVLQRLSAPRLQALAGVGIAASALLLTAPQFRASYRFLVELKHDPRIGFCTWADPLLRPFQALAPEDTMVLAEPDVNICLPGYAPYAG